MQVFLRGNPTLNAVVASAAVLGLLIGSFSLFEPVVAQGQINSNDFTVTQEIQSELAFLTQPNDVSMSDPIQGLTGGNSYGTSTFNITTNDPDGYTVSVAFSTTTAMQGDGIDSVIDNYTPAVGGTPDFTISVPDGDAEFAYRAANVTTPADTDDKFKNNGAACNAGAAVTGNTCWYNVADATSDVTIIDADAATVGTGATSTLVFQVAVGANPTPALETGFYIATGTLTATVK